MKFSYTVEFEVERVTGKFADRESLGEVIVAELEQVQPDLSGTGPDGNSEYEITSGPDVSENDLDTIAVIAKQVAALRELSKAVAFLNDTAMRAGGKIELNARDWRAFHSALRRSGMNGFITRPWKDRGFDRRMKASRAVAMLRVEAGAFSDRRVSGAVDTRGEYSDGFRLERRVSGKTERRASERRQPEGSAQ